MIRFNKASITELEKKNVIDAMENSILSGDGKYTSKVYEQFKERFGIQNMLLTTSGTTALEMASILIELEPGDEIIVPSFTFSSTVNAFLLRGARPVFCDIRKDTMNIDENLIEDKITKNTKAIYAVDYAGIPCEMDKINEIANKHGLFVIEDAAQAVGSTYKGKYAGTLTEFGCYSFHETKNYAMGEGGAIVINQEKYMDRAEIIREKGTSFLPSDILAAILSAQMERYDEIMEKRMNVWNIYHEQLMELEKEKKLVRQFVPDNVEHNAHMYNIVLPTENMRTKLVMELKKKEIMAYICYVPLHSAPMGLKLGYHPEDCPVTEDYGKRVLRLPLYADMTSEDAQKVVDTIEKILK